MPQAAYGSGSPAYASSLSQEHLDPDGASPQVAAHTEGELPSRYSSTGPALAAQVLYPDVAATHTHRDDIETLAAQGIFDEVVQAQEPFFDDVDKSHIHYQDIRALDEMGVLTYCEREEDGFCPDDPIDRKTMAVWTVRILDGEDPPRPPGGSRFDDVDCCLPRFYPPFIERLAELRVTRGCGDGSGFCPERSVTRAEMAAFLARAFNLPDGPDPGFSDVPDDLLHAADIARLAHAGITRGCRDGTKFCPSRVTTRAEMSAFLNRAISLSQSDEEDSTDQDSLGEEIVVPVYYCGPTAVYDQERLNEEVGRFNSTISSFYREQSQGAVDLRFKAREILSPEVDWSDQAANSITAWVAARRGPCDRPTGLDQFVPGFEKSIVLAHVPPGQDAYGYSRSGMAPVAVVPTAEMLELHTKHTRAVHLVTVAHELGHLLWDFNHPDEEGRTSEHDRKSLMSHSTVLDLTEAYIACYQRQLAGWLTASDYCDETARNTDPSEQPAPDDQDNTRLAVEIS